jgi:hypothetical protein
MREFTLDVLQWRCGNSKRFDSESLGGDQTLLYHPDYTVHNTCVMGQMLWRAGAKLEDLAKLAGPDTYLQLMYDRHGEKFEGDTIWWTPELRALLNILVMDTSPNPPGLTRSWFARDLERINDDVVVCCSVWERIVCLRERLAQEGISLNVCNYVSTT